MNQIKYSKKLEDIFPVMEELSSKFQNNHKEELEYLYIMHLLREASLRFLLYKEGKNKRKEIINLMKNKFPNWKNNKYFKNESFKNRLICKMLYTNNVIPIKIYLTLKSH